MPRNALFLVMSSFRNIKRIKGNNVYHGLIDMAGGWLVLISHSLTELHLDNSQLYSLSLHTFELYSVDREYSRSLFMYCDSLERLSIKNDSWFIRPEEEGEGNMLSQEMMVRNYPALRWLRSNLLEENIAMLRQERQLCD
mmetsp:Transcript_2506/g.4567  ORF Transcript_2506/g.4567 Transcript_2506/m.4567 type:complete len:140 (-) Transcript_2506:137-556(-)